MTIFLNLDAPPKPSDIELTALDRQAWERREPPSVTPHTRCCLDYYVRLRNGNGEPPGFRQYLVEQERADAILTITQWDSLLAVFDARDARQTEMGARYAGVPR